MASTFIGSSSEMLDFARAIQHALRGITDCIVWSQDVFVNGTFPVTTLLDELQKHDFAIMILAPDDRTTSRRKQRLTPRDNVVFELGLFMAKLGPKRTFMLFDASKFVKLPSDINGITMVPFDGEKLKTLEGSSYTAEVETLCYPVIRAVRACEKLAQKQEVGDRATRKRLKPIKWINVSGSGDEENPLLEEVVRTCHLVGQRLAEADFGVVTGAWPLVDEEVTKAYTEKRQELKRPFDDFVLNVLPVNGYRGDSRHKIAGRSKLSDTPYTAWAETAKRSDAGILIAGEGGALQTALWLTTLGKPVFALPQTGGDAEKYFFTAKALGFQHNIPGVNAEEYEHLGDSPVDAVGDLMHLLEQWAHQQP